MIKSRGIKQRLNKRVLEAIGKEEFEKITKGDIKNKIWKNNNNNKKNHQENTIVGYNNIKFDENVTKKIKKDKSNRKNFIKTNKNDKINFKKIDNQINNEKEEKEIKKLKNQRKEKMKLKRKARENDNFDVKLYFFEKKLIKFLFQELAENYIQKVQKKVKWNKDL